MKQLSRSAALAILLTVPAPGRAAGPIEVVAAENFYGDVAQQIGGPDVKVTSILSNPDEDPHLFEASPSVARNVAVAPIVIYNGIGYDPWMEKLLKAAAGNHRITIAVADLTGRRSGDNPHIWYDPATMPVLAKALAHDLARLDAAHEGGYRERLRKFQRSMRPLATKIGALRARILGTPVTATEPVFGCMLQALGLRVHGISFQMAVMNNTEPGAADVASFESDLERRRVKMLVYNSQATDPVAQHMERLAAEAHIPVVGATETEPAGKNYQAWIMGELDAVDRALPQ